MYRLRIISFLNGRKYGKEDHATCLTHMIFAAISFIVRIVSK